MNNIDETSNINLESIITCPECGFDRKETMPTDSCQIVYECTHCKTILMPKKGDCCVYCSYGSVPCPPIQDNNGCCF
ncbi:MAG: GDCCVxC domain-containing (seleno)protein [Candidatus Anammoxibacter sp.]